MENIENLENIESEFKDPLKECLYRIVQVISYPNDKIRIDIVSYAEEIAKDFFPELSVIDEVHMDQIEYAYNKWKTFKKIPK